MIRKWLIFGLKKCKIQGFFVQKWKKMTNFFWKNHDIFWRITSWYSWRIRHDFFTKFPFFIEIFSIRHDFFYYTTRFFSPKLSIFHQNCPIRHDFFTFFFENAQKIKIFVENRKFLGVFDRKIAKFAHFYEKIMSYWENLNHFNKNWKILDIF